MTTSPTSRSSRSRALLWWGAAALVLLAGYLDLARGGETIAPILLIIGYVVLVPAAILKG
jgi:energy-converting hydrogenase Eha subunit C